MAFIQCKNPECGKFFEGRKTAKYCCEKCRQRAKILSKTRVEVCAHCKKEFLTAHSKQRYCCLYCKQQYEYERYDNKHPKTEKVCARKGCNEVFLGGVKKIYCCRQCAHIVKKEKSREYHAKCNTFKP